MNGPELEGPDIIDVEHSPSWMYFLRQTLMDVRLSEPPIVALGVFFVVWFFILYKTRRRTRSSVVVFGLTCLGIGFSPRINAFMGDARTSRWAMVGFTKNYFDFSGYFILLFWAGPLMLEAVVFLILLFVDVVKMYWQESVLLLLTRWKREKKRINSD
jgi:hypothetical protein